MISYKQKLNKISTFILDVDGVLTDGKLILMPTGEMVRTMHTKDGFAMQLAIKKALKSWSSLVEKMSWSSSV